jgi:hypothetical protein
MSETPVHEERAKRPIHDGWYLWSEDGLLHLWQGGRWQDRTLPADHFPRKRKPHWRQLRDEPFERYNNGAVWTDQTRPLAGLPDTFGNRYRAKYAGQSKALVGCLTVVLVLVVISGVIAGISAFVHHGPGDQSFQAYDACQGFVKDRLKAPATANFESLMDASVSRVGQEYTVTAYVDAQNSFGAKLREAFTCVVDRNAHGTWSLYSLTGLSG